MKMIEKIGVHLFNLREKFEEHHPSEIKVMGTAFPGVVFESHGRFHEIIREKKGIIVYFNPEVGHIEEKPIS
jgi:hypothetical protein